MRIFRRQHDQLSADDVPSASYIQVLRDYHGFLRLVVQCMLVVIGTFSLLRGVGYSPFLIPEKLPLAVSLTSTFIPLTVWATLWFMSGVACFFGAWLVRPATTLGVVILSFTWAVGYTGAWLYGLAQPTDDEVRQATYRDWLSASTYWTVCLVAFGGRHLALASLRLTQTKPSPLAPSIEFPRPEPLENETPDEDRR